MKKIMLGVGILVSGVIIMGSFWNKNREQTGEYSYEEHETKNNMSETTEVLLLAKAETLEEAEKIAALYEIELVSFGDKIAVYRTEKNPDELISMGKERGYPAIARNHSNSVY